ncbi:MAG: hypothetical protein HYS35_05680 [Betaproteobacteria bacterium]|nr:hypothetical protein [Betaproteobacteria bacterium]
MKTVGNRSVPDISLQPSGELLKRAAAINDAAAALLPGGLTPIVKGIYRYRTLAEANRHQDEMTAAAMAADSSHQ